MKILCVFHETALSEAVEGRDSLQFSRAGYSRSGWSRRPNSTVRLNIVNYLALRELSSDFNIEFRMDLDWSEELIEDYKQYDVIIMNQVPLQRSLSFCESLLAWHQELTEKRPLLILGTEVTWDKALRLGQISAETYNRVYHGKDIVLLRHTARTDRPIYARGKGSSTTVQEFELGIDTRPMPEGAPVAERKYITFVRAPEGRATKNNDAIDELVSMVKSSVALSRFEVREFVPPYSVLDYWEVLSRSAFLVFTSLGETFSYAMNDAKMLGVVTLFPEQMYFTSVQHLQGSGEPSWYAVDSYPEIGTRYRSAHEALAIMTSISSSGELLEGEMQRSFRSADDLFSLRAVVSNWRKLLNGRPVRENGLFIYGPTFTRWSDVVKTAHEVRCGYVMPHLNEGVLGANDKVSYHDYAAGVSRILSNLTKARSGQLHRTLHYEEGRAVVGLGPSVDEYPFQESASFIQLLCRTYGISRIVLDGSLVGTEAEGVCSEAQVFGGASAIRVPVRVSVR